jgi:hypothetical protein
VLIAQLDINSKPRASALPSMSMTFLGQSTARCDAQARQLSSQTASAPYKGSTRKTRLGADDPFGPYVEALGVNERTRDHEDHSYAPIPLSNCQLPIHTIRALCGSVNGWGTSDEPRARHLVDVVERGGERDGQ